MEILLFVVWDYGLLKNSNTVNIRVDGKKSKQESLWEIAQIK